MVPENHAKKIRAEDIVSQSYMHIGIGIGMVLGKDYPLPAPVPANEGGRGKPFKRRDMVAVSWPPDEYRLWEDFQAAMKRDGWTAAEIIRFWVRAYLQDHPLGNPQTPLERFKELPKPKVVDVQSWRKMSKKEEYEFRRTHPILWEKTRK